MRYIILVLGAVFLLCGCNDEGPQPVNLSSIPANEQRAVDLGEGESAWMQWYSMHADYQGNCYIKCREAAYKDRPDHESFKVIRKGQGYIVDLSGSTHRWEKANYTIAAGSDNLPVVEWRNSR